MRQVLLAASENRWLRQRAPQLPGLRHAVSRFMPGERLEDALGAATALGGAGMSTIVTRLGENVTDRADAEAVTAHYIEALGQIARGGIDCQISVKLTQLGLDVDREHSYRNLARLAEAASGHGQPVWIDMEQSQYVDVTLELYHRAREEFGAVGVCLQAYLYRTEADLAAIVEAGGRVRLVKGAYQEPATIAHPKKRDVDRAYCALADTMLGERAEATGFEAVFGTHDPRMIEHVRARATVRGLPPSRYEFALLYGIQRGEQERLAREGERIRVLISYGESWFPWYMRRLAERPANVWFALRNLRPW
jgi:proline dehydrogenase